MAVWGAVRYPGLPDRLPAHIGPDGIDAWTAKGVGAAFVPVFIYAGLTVVLTGCAALATRITPQDELPEPRNRWSGAAAAMTNRPASGVSARRTARSLLIMNALSGAGFLPLCWLQWRTPETAAVPAWVMPGTLTLFLLGLVPVGVACARDMAEKRTARA
ncbi:hypothetical protein DB35_12035 [Streptomyces abyssalis]|uniref:DUF1648 domain-containing protein n=2 Tax=Streptomyces abyssalis TaxID=933944 RepID=A0A1E7JIT8_9ACTN|nr:hypothetical protein AN215_25905 [Streptomyces abyssalis]OEU93264.1 hypothetical protein DB35_12035 [Streptomyces abyssalis]OEV31776.1 hypothetical protein AN219_03145 [Streptomyces nanshensis]